MGGDSDTPRRLACCEENLPSKLLFELTLLHVGQSDVGPEALSTLSPMHWKSCFNTTHISFLSSRTLSKETRLPFSISFLLFLLQTAVLPEDSWKETQLQH